MVQLERVLIFVFVNLSKKFFIARIKVRLEILKEYAILTV